MVTHSIRIPTPALSSLLPATSDNPPHSHLITVKRIPAKSLGTCVFSVSNCYVLNVLAII